MSLNQDTIKMFQRVGPDKFDDVEYVVTYSKRVSHNFVYYDVYLGRQVIGEILRTTRTTGRQSASGIYITGPYQTRAWQWKNREGKRWSGYHDTRRKAAESLLYDRLLRQGVAA